MKILALSLLTVAGLTLVGWQHQQLGQLHAENATLQQSAAEADHLKSDLAKFDGAQAQDAAAEVDRLREENRDLLKLRNEVNQLRDVRTEFDKLSAANKQLQSKVSTLAKVNSEKTPMQPIRLRIQDLFNKGFSTPEATVQTFFWAERENNIDELQRCFSIEQWPYRRNAFENGPRRNLENVTAIEIVARREVNATSVVLGVQIRSDQDSWREKKMTIALYLVGGEWKLDIN